MITDRLHGMIFCAISENPCIVFGNYNQKVKGAHEKINNLPYIKHIDSMDNINLEIDNLLKIRDRWLDFLMIELKIKYNDLNCLCDSLC